MNAIDILLREHRLIERVLASLESFANRLGEKPEKERAALRDFVYFFKKFADHCHHGKEENYLFAKMNSYGFAKDHGPVSAMLSEQGEGRDHVLAMSRLAEENGPLSPTEREVLQGHAIAYVIRMRSHIQREDEILFPIARHSLPADVLHELGAQFVVFDIDVITPPILERVHAIAENLVAEYPPQSPETLAQ